MEIVVPELALVVLIGPSGSGKSEFARKHFLASEVLSSDACRAMVSDDPNDQTVTREAFEILHFIGAKRLAAGRLTVVDATNVQPEARKPLVDLAREYHCLPVAIVLNMPESVCHERNRHRPDRNFGPHVVRQQHMQLRRSLRHLTREGFRRVFVLNTEEDVNAATLGREPLWNNRRDDHGPFDIIGDVHGCADELELLLAALGYAAEELPTPDPLWGSKIYRHPEGRRIVFLGDLVDRGPRILDALRLAHNMVAAGTALCVPGNHDIKFMRALRGRDVQRTHGLVESLTEVETLPEEIREPFRNAAAAFVDDLVSHYVLDDGKLVVAHAGMKQSMQGRGSGKVRDFALYGESTGETDAFGLPIRFDWAGEYRGSAMVVYGHTPVPTPEWLNHTVNIDTGCVFGGSLTALRYPEREFVSIPCARTYYEPIRPFLAAGQGAPLSAQQTHDDLLEIEDVQGKRIITTRLRGTVIIRERNAAAALEVMSRFAVNPKWLIYLPPTMAPCETSSLEGYLEYPTEAFAYYRSVGVPQVVCEEKHMGSRAVVVVCRDAAAARDWFGIADGESGIVCTRTGRRFFTNPAFETELLDRIRGALHVSDFWNEFETTWACLDCELMPWSAKAQELLRSQYAALGAAGRAATPQVVDALIATATRLAGDTADGQAVQALAQRFDARDRAVNDFVAAYRRYCWTVNSVDELRLAPFHLMATEGQTHIERDHVWHMDTLARICHHDRVLLATPYRVVDVTDAASLSDATAWWENLTNNGGEGMVVKPFSFVANDKRGLVQPAVKCRGREYLRIIYGPEYTAPENLTRLRSRGLGAKRSLAIREFALGVDALERFIRNEPLRRVHECVFGVLALESEPVDPRL